MLHITKAPSFSKLTTLHLGGTALALIDAPTVASLDALPETLARLGGKPLPFGYGSNILADDGDLPISLVRMTHPAKPQCLPDPDNKERVLVQVPTSMKLPRFLAWCASKGLSGLEGLAGIPGHIGGALAMNAGSYGSSFCEHLKSVQHFSSVTGLTTSKASDCTWAYRHFSLPRGKEHMENMENMEHEEYSLFIHATLQLTIAPKMQIIQRMKEHIAKKIATQPMQVYSAGCVFKNPAHALSAGRLLDEAGFRGKQLGGVSFSMKHANFLVNNANGTARQAFELMHMACEGVKQQHGVTLESEIKVVSCH